MEQSLPSSLLPPHFPITFLLPLISDFFFLLSFWGLSYTQFLRCRFWSYSFLSFLFIFFFFLFYLAHTSLFNRFHSRLLFAFTPRHIFFYFLFFAVSATGFVTDICNSKFKVALAIYHSTAHSIATHTDPVGCPPCLTYPSSQGGKGHLIFICHHHLDQF
jgi:hypothetical protein